MLIQASAEVGWTPAFELEGTGEQGLDDLVAQHPQCRQAAYPFRRWLIAMGVASLLHHLLASQFLQIVSHFAVAVLTRLRASQGLDFGTEFRGRLPKAVTHVTASEPADLLSVLSVVVRNPVIARPSAPATLFRPRTPTS